MPTPEGAVLKAVLSTLNLRGVYAFRNNSGALRDATGRPVRFGKVGSADILGIVYPIGRFLAVECKAPGREKTLTEAQWEFMASIKAAGGVALVISDVADLWRALDELEADPGKSFDLPPRPEPKKRRTRKANI